MIAILSPAKTLDFNSDYKLNNFTIPAFMSESKYLVDELRRYSSTELSNLMNLSPSLSDLNFQRYQDWDINFDLSNSRQSIFCFKGGVYVGLNIESFSNSDLAYGRLTVSKKIFVVPRDQTCATSVPKSLVFSLTYKL